MSKFGNKQKKKNPVKKETPTWKKILKDKFDWNTIKQQLPGGKYSQRY